jgi:hypothetical protein
VAAFLFLAVIPPGLAYLAVLSLSKPRRTETPFIEGSRCVAVSLASTATAILLLALVPWLWRGRWPSEVTAAVKSAVTDQNYVLDNLYAVAGFVVLEAVLAMGAAVVAALVIKLLLPPAKIKHDPLWYQLFRLTRPPGTKTWIIANMRGGHRYEGALITYCTDDVPVAERELVIGPAPYAQPRDGKREEMTDVERLVISGAELESLGVSYYREVPASESDPS